jgi:hypothetical protein
MIKPKASLLRVFSLQETASNKLSQARKKKNIYHNFARSIEALKT